MAISIDEVYQTVLALANKEQRGYITPQEFNLFANQAQMEIFEQYFYDLNQFKRVPGNNTGHADMVTILEEKISLFERKETTNDFSWGDLNLSLISDNFYRLESINVLYSNNKIVRAEKVSLKQLVDIESPLTTYNKKRPVYTRDATTPAGNNTDRVNIYPHPTTSDSVTVLYIKKPTNVNWAYITAEETPIYNDSASIDFELHHSDKSELVYRILAFAGVSIERPQLIQLSSSAVAGQVQQEKQ